ncbi:MAG: beta-propeller fold lactonase family protein [Gemmataceae bacterium]|nr:beta-propeller fold lactonase family protein [Gemmataceae bacterium]
MRASRIRIWVVILATAVAGAGLFTRALPTLPGEEALPAPAAAYRSPLALVVSPDGKILYASDRTACAVAVLDAVGRTKRAEIPLSGKPHGLSLSADGGTLYVAERGAGSVAILDTVNHAVTGRIAVGRWPVALAVAPQTKRLYVCNQDNHSLSVIDLSQSPGRCVKQIPLVREPSWAAVTPDERFVVVANLLPHGLSTDPTLAAEVSIVDATQLVQAKPVKLPPGSSVVQGVCTSPDGRWAYVVHGLGHFNLPMTQLERGWVNTYALSILDLAQGSRLATVLLDDLTQGAADPHAVVCSKDGARLWISHAGTHEISRVEIGLVHELLEGKVPAPLAELRDGSLPNIWVRIQQDRRLIKELAYDLTALYIAGAIRRVPSGGQGPRGLALSPDGQILYVANYFSGAVAALNAADGKLRGTIPLGPPKEPDAVRRGEIVFHDATRSFQHWHSCASCHPNDGRVDGLRWDFADDGLGNGMNTLNLFYPDKTEPLHRLGTLATVRVAAKHGLTFTHLLVPTEQDVDDLVGYLTSLRPEPSPHLAPNGQLTEAARRGQVLFEGKADCVRCHGGTYFTDRKLYDVGTNAANEKDARFKTPALFELYRTAPYLHDGRALTVKAVLTTYNSKDLHGKTTGLTESEVNDLVAYLLSL